MTNPVQGSQCMRYPAGETLLRYIGLITEEDKCSANASGLVSALFSDVLCLDKHQGTSQNQKDRNHITAFSVFLWDPGF